MNVKTLKAMETLSERFVLVDSDTTPPILDVQLDGVSISIADLVSIANKLTTALEDKGVTFKPAGKAH